MQSDWSAAPERSRAILEDGLRRHATNAARCIENLADHMPIVIFMRGAWAALLGWSAESDRAQTARGHPAQRRPASFERDR